MEIHGPYYTFEETKVQLNLVDSELNYLIDKKNLTAVLYSTDRQWLIHRRTEQDWIGYGVCRYRGIVGVHQEVISKLLDGKTAFIGTGAGRFVEKENAINITRGYPYKQQLPHWPITEWNDQPIPQEQLLSYLVTPAPTEALSVKHLLEDFTVEMERIRDQPQSKSVAGATSSTKKTKELALNFNYGNPFTPSDIRIPKSEIERYIREHNVGISPLSGSKPVRENALHNVFIRLITAHPKLKTKQQWELLKKDHESDIPVFDQSGIIQKMDDLSIEWSLSNGGSGELKRSSFGPTISRLRENLK
jgi:hypothetical protein